MQKESTNTTSINRAPAVGDSEIRNKHNHGNKSSSPSATDNLGDTTLLSSSDVVRQLTEDTFSFLLCTDFSTLHLPGNGNASIIGVSILIWCMQMAIYFSVLFNSLAPSGSDYRMNFPLSVDLPTRIAELIAILITTLSQEDFRTAVMLVVDKYDDLTTPTTTTDRNEIETGAFPTVVTGTIPTTRTAMADVAMAPTTGSSSSPSPHGSYDDDDDDDNMQDGDLSVASYTTEEHNYYDPDSSPAPKKKNKKKSKTEKKNIITPQDPETPMESAPPRPPPSPTTLLPVVNDELLQFQQAFPEASRISWLVSITLRFSSGILGIITTFVLIMQSEHVIQLLLNFTAMEFVSHLDDVGYQISKMGYLGLPLQFKAKEISETKYTIRESNGCIRRGMRPLLLVGVFIALLFGWATILYKQSDGQYATQHIFVQFSDTFLSDLGALSGYYHYTRFCQMTANGAGCDGKRRNVGPIAYESTFTVRSETSTMTTPITTRAFFAYCRTLDTVNGGAWTFTYSDEMGEWLDPCTNWVARSDSEDDGKVTASDAFDILKVASSRWIARKYTGGQEVVLEHFQLFATLNYGETSSSSCSNPKTFGPRCEYHQQECSLLNNVIQQDLQTSKGYVKFADPYYQLLEDVTIAGRPVFYYHDVTTNDNNDHRIGIVLFNGRRWIVTWNDGIEDCRQGQDQEEECISVSTLSQFLQTKFHPYWSNYQIEFISDAVDINKASDGAYPRYDLNWYTPKRPRQYEKLSTPNIRQNIGSTLDCCKGSSCLRFINSMEQSSNNCKEGTENVIIKITTDEYPDETSVVFTFLDRYGNPGQSEEFPPSPFTTPFQTEVFEFCLPRDICASLTIMDQGGDGIRPPGGYEAYVNQHINITAVPFSNCHTYQFGICTGWFQPPQCGCTLCTGEDPVPDPDQLVPASPFLSTVNPTGYTNCGSLVQSREFAEMKLQKGSKQCQTIQATWGQYCGCPIPSSLEASMCRLCGDNVMVQNKWTIDKGETCLHYELKIQNWLNQSYTCNDFRLEQSTVEKQSKCCG